MGGAVVFKAFSLAARFDGAPHVGQVAALICRGEPHFQQGREKPPLK